MSKKALLLMMTLLMAVATVILPLAGATISPVAAGCVRVHYLRTDFNYDGWTLYVWGGGYTGETVTWDSSLTATGMDEYGPYWDTPYGSGALNFIVHKGDAKQYAADRSFPDPAAGEEVWVIQDNGNYYTTAAAALAAAGITAVPAIPAGYTRIYYLRLDKTYDGWGLHGWTSSGDLPGVSWGAPLPITGYDKYGYAYWDVPSDIAGYIIHKGDTKDTPANRTLDGSNNENYVVSGDPANYTDRLTAVQKAGNRITSATLTALNTIQFTTLTAIDENAAVSVMDAATGVLISNIDRSQAPVYTITLARNLDIKLYRLTVGNMSADVMVAPALLDTYCAYDGKLGAIYSATATTFKLWAPLADEVKLLFFSSNDASDPSGTVGMTKGGQGVWSCTVSGNLEGRLYQYQVTHGGTAKRVLDPYAVSMAAFNSGGADQVGKAAVIDLSKTNPDYWKQDHYVKLNNPEDAIIYEAHVRDFTIADTAVPEAKRGTYEGLIAKIPYLKELGVTHVQLQPVQNWYYGNESYKTYESGMATDNSNYNWGYDPHNYFTPEGWFASDPGDPYARVRELKRLIRELHKAGIGVLFDVVYNHTAVTNIFEDIVPYYYYRRNEDGTFTGGSGCGNDTASERAMFRKLMIDSAAYWVREYHVDGFRFDLMGLHDITTMKQLTFACRLLNPYVELHGEGWDLGTLPLHDRYIKGGGSDSDYHRALLEVSRGIAAFSDGMRDGLIQQNYQTPAKGGFVQHDTSYDRNNEAYVRRGIVGNIVDYSTGLPINDAKYDCFCDDPEESVNYTTCHDGLTINDKLNLTLPSASRSEFIKRYKLQCAMVLTSQGKAFFQAGEELFRSKPATDPSANQNYISDGYCHNSHDASDDINKIDWSGYQAGDPETVDLHDFYAGMIALRKAHRAFRMETAEMVQNNLAFIDEDIDGIIAYRIRRADGKDEWKDIIVIFNSTSALQTVNISGVDLTGWKVVVDGDRVDLNGITTGAITLGEGAVTVPPVSAVVIHAPVTTGGDTTPPTVTLTAPADGSYSLTAKAYDAAGNEGTSSAVMVTVSNVTDLKVHCKNNSVTNWTVVKCYYWGSDGSPAANTWPGETMTSEENGWYYFVVPGATSANVIFNGGSNISQTVDLSRSAEGWFVPTGTSGGKIAGTWYDYNPDGPQPPAVAASPAGSDFYTDTLSITLSVSGTGITASRYTLDGSDPAEGGTSYANGTVITIGAGMAIGDSKTLRLYATNDAESASQTYTFTKTEAPEHAAFDWKNATVYFVMTDRFYNGNTSNDNSYGRTKDGGQEIGTFHGGDLAGLTQKLNDGYFTNLGVNAIWITAPYEQIHGWTGGTDGNYKHYGFHGYYALDFTKVDANMGTEAELKTFIDTAHANGVRVIFDVVMNHAGYNTIKDMNEFGFGKWTGSALSDNWTPGSGQNWNPFHNYISYTSGASEWAAWWGPDWIRAGLAGYTSPGSDDLTMSLAYLPDFKTESTNYVGLPNFYARKSDTKATYIPNYTVRKYLIKWLTDWVRTYGVDGFRCDTAKHVELPAWAELKTAAVQALREWKTANPGKKLDDLDFWMTGEYWGHGPDYSSYYANGFDSMINFSYQSAVSSAIDNYGNIESLYASYAAKTNCNPLSYISSHDTSLFYSGDTTRQKKVGTLFLLTPKAVQIYYGDENCRSVGPFGGSSDQGLRSDMPWPGNSDVLAHWQKIGQFRNKHLAVGAGSHAMISSSPYTFSRIKDNDKVACVLGASGQTTVNVSSVFGDGTAVRDFYTGQTATVSGGKATFTANANGVILIESIDDTKAPIVSLTAPSDGTTLSGTATLSANASDDVGVTKVEFYYGTGLIASDTTAPYSVSWDTAAVANGPYSLTAKAYDAAGNVSASTAVDVTVNNSLTGGLTVHFKNNTVTNWSTLKCYYWGSNGSTAANSWPGQTMTSEGNDWYFFVIPGATSSNVIFDNGSAQTVVTGVQ